MTRISLLFGSIGTTIVRSAVYLAYLSRLFHEGGETGLIVAKVGIIHPMRAKSSNTKSTKSSTYQVPERFGAGGMLALIFVFSVIFGCLHRMDARWGYYLFFAVLGLVVGGSQMRGARNPRFSSIIAGTVLLPPSLLVTAIAMGGIREPALFFVILILSTFFGAGVGYMMGTLLGGAFLLADYLERYFDPRERALADDEESIVLAVDVTELRERQKKWLIDPPSEPP